MEILYKMFSGVLAALFSLLSPILPLSLAVLIFIAIDFLTGVAADRKEHLESNERWYFESHLAWRTLYKAGFSLIAIVMAWTLEHYVLEVEWMHLARMFAGFICGVELWSFLENASTISSSPLFIWLRRYAKRRIGKEAKR